MSSPQLHSALHWPSFLKTLTAELCGLALVGAYLGRVKQLSPAPEDAVLVAQLHLLPGFFAGWFAISATMLASRRVEKRFPIVWWSTACGLRCLIVVFLGSLFLGVFRYFEVSGRAVVLLALGLSLISALLYPILWRRAEKQGRLIRKPPSIRNALLGLMAAELAILCLVWLIVVLSFGEDPSTLEKPFAWSIVVWAMTLLPIVRLQTNHHASGKPIRIKPILLLQVLRGWFAFFVYWIPWAAGGIDGSPILLPTLIAGTGLGVAVGFLPAFLLVHLRRPLERAAKAPNARPSLSWAAAFTALGCEMLFGITCVIVYAIAGADSGGSMVVLDQWVPHGILVYVPVSWAIRWGFVLQAGGWRGLGGLRFLGICIGTSAIYPLIWTATMPSDNGLLLLGISLSSALVGGGAYILDCKLRADESLPS